MSQAVRSEAKPTGPEIPAGLSAITGSVSDPARVVAHLLGAPQHRGRLGRVDHRRLAGRLAHQQIGVVVTERRDPFDAQTHGAAS